MHMICVLQFVIYVIIFLVWRAFLLRSFSGLLLISYAQAAMAIAITSTTQQQPLWRTVALPCVSRIQSRC